MLYNTNGDFIAGYHSSMIFNNEGRHIGSCLGRIVYRVNGAVKEPVGYIKGNRIYRGIFGSASLVGHFDNEAVYNGSGNNKNAVAFFEKGEEGSVNGAAAALLLCQFKEEGYKKPETAYEKMQITLKMIVDIFYSGFINFVITILTALRVIAINTLQPKFIFGIALLVSGGIYFYINEDRYIALYQSRGFSIMISLLLGFMLVGVVYSIYKKRIKQILLVLLTGALMMPATYLLYLATMNTVGRGELNSVIMWFFMLYPFMLYTLFASLLIGYSYQLMPHESVFFPVLSSVSFNMISASIYTAVVNIPADYGWFREFSYTVVVLMLIIVFSLPGVVLSTIMVEAKKMLVFKKKYEQEDGGENKLALMLAIASKLRRQQYKIIAYKRLSCENKVQHMNTLLEPLMSFVGEKTMGRGLVAEIGSNYLLVRVNYSSGSKISSRTVKLYPSDPLTAEAQIILIDSFITYSGEIGLHNCDLLTTVSSWDFSIENAIIRGVIQP